MDVVNSPQQFLDPLTAGNSKRLFSTVDSRRPLDAKQKRCQSGAMIEMQMADPNGIQIHPVDILLGHAVGRIGTAIEHDRSGFGL